MKMLFNFRNTDFSFSLHRITGVKFLFLLMFSLLSNQTFSQTVEAKVSSDTNAIIIGNQFLLKLEVSHPANIPVEWPVIADTFSLMEIVQRSNLDTIRDSSKDLVITKQSFIVTSFDSGYHVIPPFVFKYRLAGDTSLKTAETDPLLISVSTVQIDTTRAIKDIKGQVVIPFSWKDALPYIFGVLLAALVGFLIYRYIKKRKAKTVEKVVAVPKRPAHEIALEALKLLDESKLWQNGNTKGYYTGLSDITRTFIENRWSVSAMEMTTDEILKYKIISDQDSEVLSKLKFMLELSDLVKFAKATPMVFENEECMKNAVAFVNANRPLDVRKETEV